MKLAIEFTDQGLRLGLYQRRLKGWLCTQRAGLPWRLDNVQAAMSEQIVATLRPTLLAWGVKPDTSVIVVPNGDVGGVLSEVGGKDPFTEEMIQTLLSKRLPYPPSEIAWTLRHVEHQGKRLVQIAWIPRGWMADLKDALDRLGLRLGEVFPLTFLISGSMTRPIATPHLWVRATEQTLALCALRPGGVAESVALVSMTGTAIDQKFSLARFALTGGAPLPVLLAAETAAASEQATALIGEGPDVKHIPAEDMVERLFRLWLDGEQGWWQPPSRDWLIGRSIPWVIAFSVLMLMALAYLTWQRQHLIEQTAKADDAASKLRPAHRRLEAGQRQLFLLTGQLLEMESYDHAKPPLDPLAVVTDLLPNGAWITHYQFDGQRYTLEGQGASTAAMIKALAKTTYRLTPIKSSIALSNKPGDGTDSATPVAVFALQIEQGNAKVTKPAR